MRVRHPDGARSDGDRRRKAADRDRVRHRVRHGIDPDDLVVDTVDHPGRPFADGDRARAVADGGRRDDDAGGVDARDVVLEDVRHPDVAEPGRDRRGPHAGDDDRCGAPGRRVDPVDARRREVAPADRPDGIGRRCERLGRGRDGEERSGLDRRDPGADLVEGRIDPEHDPVFSDRPDHAVPRSERQRRGAGRHRPDDSPGFRVDPGHGLVVEVRHPERAVGRDDASRLRADGNRGDDLVRAGIDRGQRVRPDRDDPG